jgi:hypothetical protein
MKNIAISALFATTLYGCAMTPIAPIENVQKVYEMPGLSQGQIYDASRQWFAESFKSANAVIQYEDKTSGSIIGKGTMKFPCMGVFQCLAYMTATVDFTIRVDTKENKMRVTYNDLTIKRPASYNSGIYSSATENPIYLQSEKDSVSAKLDLLTDDMADKIKKGQKYNSNW